MIVLGALWLVLTIGSYFSHSWKTALLMGGVIIIVPPQVFLVSVAAAEKSTFEDIVPLVGPKMVTISDPDRAFRINAITLTGVGYVLTGLFMFWIAPR